MTFSEGWLIPGVFGGAIQTDLTEVDTLTAALPGLDSVAFGNNIWVGVFDVIDFFGTPPPYPVMTSRDANTWTPIANPFVSVRAVV